MTLWKKYTSLDMQAKYAEHANLFKSFFKIILKETSGAEFLGPVFKDQSHISKHDLYFCLFQASRKSLH